MQSNKQRNILVITGIILAAAGIFAVASYSAWQTFFNNAQTDVDLATISYNAEGPKGAAITLLHSAMDRDHQLYQVASRLQYNPYLNRKTPKENAADEMLQALIAAAPDDAKLHALKGVMHTTFERYDGNNRLIALLEFEKAKAVKLDWLELKKETISALNALDPTNFNEDDERFAESLKELKAKYNITPANFRQAVRNEIESSLNKYPDSLHLLRERMALNSSIGLVDHTKSLWEDCLKDSDKMVAAARAGDTAEQKDQRFYLYTANNYKSYALLELGKAAESATVAKKLYDDVMKLSQEEHCIGESNWANSTYADYLCYTGKFDQAIEYIKKIDLQVSDEESCTLSAEFDKETLDERLKACEKRIALTPAL